MNSENIIIAIASGKGGTGKTFVSTNLFYSLHQQSNEITLVDCDAEAPNVKIFFQSETISRKKVIQRVPVINQNKCVFCGRCHEYCSYNAIFFVPSLGIINAMEELCHGCGACFVACRDGAIEPVEKVLGTVTRYKPDNHSVVIESRSDVGVYSPVSVIKEAIKEAGEKGIIILDSPPGTSCPFIHTVNKADFVLLVTEPTPFGLSDLKQSVEILRQMGKPFGVLINRAGIGDFGVYDYIISCHIPLLGEIRFMREIALAYSDGKILAQHQPLWQQKFIELFHSIKQIVWKQQ